MRLARNVRLSMRALSAHRMRTTLAVVGTALGVGGVLVLTAIGEGAQAEVMRRVDSLGRNVFVIAARERDTRAGRTRRGETRSTDLTNGDAVAISRGLASVRRVAPVRDLARMATAGTIVAPTTIVGTTSDWLPVRQYALQAGRFISDAENAQRARVAVLGARARDNLFGASTDVIGTTFRIGWVPFEVIGVLEAKGISVDGSTSEDERIIVPLETALRRLTNLDYLKMIYAEAAPGADIAIAQAEAAALLRARHQPADGSDDFDISSQQTVLAAELQARASFRRLLLGFGMLSLIVGGVGVLSIMLLSVRERRGEIGLRIAVGARRPDIIVQFLTEALLLAAAGGLSGILLGIAVAGIVSTTTEWAADVTGYALVVAVTSAAVIGACAGVLPAWRAASLDPIDALQSE